MPWPRIVERSHPDCQKPLRCSFRFQPGLVHGVHNVTSPLARNFAPPLLPFVLAPILFGFAPHGGCIRVLHFEPIGRAAGTVGGILLRDNAFEPELAREARAYPRARQCAPPGAGRVAFTSTGSEVWCGSYLSSHSRLCSGAGIV